VWDILEQGVEAYASRTEERAVWQDRWHETKSTSDDEETRDDVWCRTDLKVRSAPPT
jgi:hypothetical protein